MKFEWHPAYILVLAVLGGVVWMFASYGTLNRCQMLREEVKGRFAGQVPEAVRASPGGALVVGLVEGGAAKLLTFDLSPNQCMVKLGRLWFTPDEKIGEVLMD